MKPLLKPFGCTLCPLSFALAKSLVKHVEVHKTKLQVGNSKKDFVQKEKKSVQKEKNSVQRQDNSVQIEKSSQNFVQKEKNSGNFYKKEDGKNVKANSKESNVSHRHRVNSLDFELGSDFYSIQKNDQNESKQSKSTENLKNNKVYAENDTNPNDSIKSEEKNFTVKSEYLEVTSPKRRRQRPVNKFRTRGAEGRKRNKTFILLQ